MYRLHIKKAMLTPQSQSQQKRRNGSQTQWIYRHWNLPRSWKYGRVRGIQPFQPKLTESALKMEISRKMPFLLQNQAKLEQI